MCNFITLRYISANISRLVERISARVSPFIILDMTIAALSALTQNLFDGILTICLNMSFSSIVSQSPMSWRYALIIASSRSFAYSKVLPQFFIILNKSVIRFNQNYSYCELIDKILSRFNALTFVHIEFKNIIQI